MSPSEALRLIAVAGLVSAALIVLNDKRAFGPALSAGIATLALAVWAVLPAEGFALRVSDFKGLTAALAVSGAKLVGERSGPLALLSVVDSPSIPFRYVPGLSLNASTTPPPQLGVFTDGGSMTAIAHFDGRREPLAYLDYTTDALAYHLVVQPTVLVLAAGGGSGVLQAIYHRASRIDAVELDPNMVRLVEDDYAQFAGGIYGRPEVRVHVAEARSFVTASTQQWDLMQFPLVDGLGAAAAGVQGLSESYLYTVEAFERYLQHLRPGGWLSITRWLDLPPRDTLKLLATALEALRYLDLDKPGQHLMLVRGLNTTTLLVKNGVVTEAEIVGARTFAEERSFDLDYYPGIDAGEVNRFNVLDQPYFYAGAMALIGAEQDAFISRYKFDITPATDDRPYFFHFLKWAHTARASEDQKSRRRQSPGAWQRDPGRDAGASRGS